LYTAGDRLSACKAPMKPVGLTMKRSRNKYQREARGELMLVHECTECQALSINRIAADDDSATVLAVFDESLSHLHDLLTRCTQDGIVILDVENREIVYTQLYGHVREIPMAERI
jgi:hypothetical protein